EHRLARASIRDFAEENGPARRRCDAVQWSLDTPSFSFYRPLITFLPSGWLEVSLEVDLFTMSINVSVGLLSGETAKLEVCLNEEVERLKCRAETALGVGRGRLLDSSGSVLDTSVAVEDSTFRDGDVLTLHLSRVQVCSSAREFCAVLGDGSAVTCGEAGSSVQLTDVRLIQATAAGPAGSAFAAILGDGSVATWGDAEYGGDSSAVQAQLKNVLQIQATCSAFAAILGDGSIVTWGDAKNGGDSSAVQAQLKNVQQIQATRSAFAAVLGDGSVVTWGLTDMVVTVVMCSIRSVVTWGHCDYGGDSSVVQEQLYSVKHIQASQSAFAAILADQSVLTWGDEDCGGCSEPVKCQLKSVQQIQATRCAFAAILGDGRVVTWGNAGYGGDSGTVQDQLKNVQQIQATRYAFAAILGGGRVVTWGNACYGGDSGAVQDQLKNVQEIQANDCAFAAILGAGSVLTWGFHSCGGDSSAVQAQLANVQEIQATRSAFAAVLSDGSVVSWSGAVERYRELFYSTPFVLSMLNMQGCYAPWELKGKPTDRYYCEYLYGNFKATLCGKVDENNFWRVNGQDLYFPTIEAGCGEHICMCHGHSDTRFFTGTWNPPGLLGNPSKSRVAMGQQTSVHVRLQDLVTGLRESTLSAVLGVRSCAELKVLVQASSPEAGGLQQTIEIQVSEGSSGSPPGSPLNVDADLFLESEEVEEKKATTPDSWKNCKAELTCREGGPRLSDDDPSTALLTALGIQLGFLQPRRPHCDSTILALVDALKRNSTVSSLHLCIPWAGPQHLQSLVELLRENSALRTLELEVVDSVNLSLEEVDAVVEACKVNLSLQRFSVVHGIRFEEDELPLGEQIDAFLERNREAFRMHQALSQVSHMQPGCAFAWPNVAFRCYVLSFVLPPGRVFPRSSWSRLV
ncbi:HERC1, partial [Symbiodinium sp. KB8]